jgi:hypothetical protein
VRLPRPIVVAELGFVRVNAVPAGKCICLRQISYRCRDL